MSKQRLTLERLKYPSIDPAMLIQIANARMLYELMKSPDVDVEFTAETKLTFRPKKEYRDYSQINHEHFLHMLIEDSHKIATKIRDDFEIPENEEASIDSFLEEYWDENEDSSELIRRIREDI